MATKNDLKNDIPCKFWKVSLSYYADLDATKYICNYCRLPATHLGIHMNKEIYKLEDGEILNVMVLCDGPCFDFWVLGH